MAGGFKVACPECGHEWAGVQSSCHIGPLFAMEEGNRQELFCPRCVIVAYFPRRIDRKTWQKWHDGLKAAKGSYHFTRAISARIDSQLASAEWYVPVTIELGKIKCPLCANAMETLTSGETWRLVCPRCMGQKTLLTEFDSLIRIVPVLGEFS